MRKITDMDENKKRVKPTKTSHFNVLDLLIIIVVLFVAAIAVMLTIPRISNATVKGQKVQISYTVVFTNVDSEVYDKITVDQTVTDSKSGRSLGIVSEAPESELWYNYVLSGTDANGGNIAVKEEYDEYGLNVTVTVTANAVYNEGSGYTVDGYRIAVGKEMSLRFPDFTETGRCDSITAISQG